MSIKLSVHQEVWLPTMPFRIANAVWESFPGIVVELQDGDLVGGGEAEGVYYFDETPATMTAQVEEVAVDLKEIVTVYTIGLEDEPEQMAAKAADAPHPHAASMEWSVRVRGRHPLNHCPKSPFIT